VRDVDCNVPVIPPKHSGTGRSPFHQSEDDNCILGGRQKGAEVGIERRNCLLLYGGVTSGARASEGREEIKRSVMTGGVFILSSSSARNPGRLKKVMLSNRGNGEVAERRPYAGKY
jgi:hypothetical protein